MKILVSLLIVGLLTGLMTAFPQAQIEKDFPDLSRIVKLDEKHADFIFAIDRSRSVKDYWDVIRQALPDFVDALPVGDSVAVIGFDATADHLLLPRQIRDRSTRQNLRNEMLQLSAPGGGNTDLFAATDKVLDEINRPGSNDLCFVFFFTDFEHMPSRASIFRQPQDRVPMLVDKYRNYVTKTKKLLQVYALQLPLSPRAGRDYGLWANIFDNRPQRILQGDSNALRDWFERTKSEIIRQKLRLALQPILIIPPVISKIQTRQHDFVLDIRNDGKLPSNIESIELNTNFGLISQHVTTAEIPAGQSVQVPIAYNSDIENLHSILQKSFPVKISEIKVEIKHAYGNQIAKLNLTENNTFTIVKSYELAVNRGLPYWVAAVVVVVLLIICFLVYQIWIKPEWIFGGRSIRFTAALDKKNLQLIRGTIESSRKAITITESVLSGSRPPSLRFSITLTPKKPAFPRSRPRRGTYVSSPDQFKIEIMERGQKKQILLNTFNSPATQHLGIHLFSTFIHEGNRKELQITLSPE